MKFEPWTFAYDKLSKKLEKIYPQFRELHLQLKKGGVLIAFKAYVALMVLASIVAFVVTIIVSLILIPILMRISYLSATNFTFSLVSASTVALVTLMVMYLYPGMKANNRNGPIAGNLTYVANFLTLLSSSNVPPRDIFATVAKTDTLKDVNLEFSNIIRDVEVFGNDLLSSIIDNATLTPNDQLRELLLGYVATVRTGGNSTEYLKIKSEKIAKDKMSKLDSLLESISAIAEIYIMLLVASPLLFSVLFVTLGMIGSGTAFGLSMGTLLYLMVYLGIPLMGVALISIMSAFEK